MSVEPIIGWGLLIAVPLALAGALWIGWRLDRGSRRAKPSKRHCPHISVRGIYGDETSWTPGYRRLQCLDCGRYLDGPVSIAVDRKPR